MESQSSSKRTRKYFIDWIRILLILSVFIYHIGMYFNTWGWHVKNNIQVTWFNDIMWFLHLWRMPLLFLVSGVGTYYALGFRTTKQYLGERTKRIFLPLLIGIFTLVPVQVYLEKASSYGSLIEFYSHMFEGIYPEGNFSWHHLWFLAYLFVIALVISPFLRSMRNGTFKRIKEYLIALCSKRLGMNWILIILILSQAILRQFFPDQTNALFNDWAYFVYYLLFFLAGFILITDDSLVQAISDQRRLYLIQTIIFTIFLFSIGTLFQNETARDWLYGVTGVIIGWACSMAALGYGKKYLNMDSKWRKIGNEGIYPFYLLHQPVILIIGFYLSESNIPIVLKIIILTVTSFTASSLIYFVLIRPFNVLRIAFGLKLKSRSEPKITIAETIPN